MGGKSQAREARQATESEICEAKIRGMSGPIHAHIFVPQDSHQRRGQNYLSTDFVVSSSVLLLFSHLLRSVLGSEAPMVLHSLNSFLSLLLVYLRVSAYCVLILSALPCSMGCDPTMYLIGSTHSQEFCADSLSGS